MRGSSDRSGEPERPTVRVVLAALLAHVRREAFPRGGAVRAGPTTPGSVSMRRRSGAHRTVGIAGAVAVLAILTAGCQTVVGTTETVRSIQQEVGALDVQVVTPDPSGERVVIRYSSQHSDEQAVRAEAQRVAEVAWRELPLQFDRAVLEPRGAPAGIETVTFSRQELQQQFGPRDAELDQGLLEAVAPFLIGVLVVVVLVTVLVVALVRRSRAGRVG